MSIKKKKKCYYNERPKQNKFEEKYKNQILTFLTEKSEKQVSVCLTWRGRLCEALQAM